MANSFDVRKLPLASADEILRVKKALRMVAEARGSLLAAARTVAQAVKPGKERWPVKTGTDADAAKVKKVIVPSTVEELNRAARPTGMKDPAKFNSAFQSKRAIPFETTIWQVEGHIVGIKLEDDGDYHLVLQGASGEFMVAEVPSPDPPFVDVSSPFRDNIRQVRTAIDKKFKKAIAAQEFLPMGKVHVPLAAFSARPSGVASLIRSEESAGQAKVKLRVSPTKVRLTGVGFFDRTHGQTGGAPNGAELHPVLSIRFS